MLELTGTLFRIDEITNLNTSNGGTFAIRTFVVKYKDPEGREQTVKFNIEPPLNLNVIENFEPGQEVTVKFFLCGRETISKFNGGMNLFEKKRVSSIELAQKKSSKTSANTQQKRIHADSYVGPDLTQDFSMFPEKIDF